MFSLAVFRASDGCYTSSASHRVFVLSTQGIGTDETWPFPGVDVLGRELDAPRTVRIQSQICSQWVNHRPLKEGEPGDLYWILGSWGQLPKPGCYRKRGNE